MANEKILDKIRKLLRMANDVGSPNEAAIAAKRARKLMDDHQVKAEDLVESDGFGTIKTNDSYAFMPIWQQHLAVAIAKWNDCQCKFAYDYGDWDGRSKVKKRVEFQGFDSDVILCNVMYEYLVSTVKRWCKEYMKSEGHTRYIASIGDSFKYGMSSSLCDRISDLTSQRQEEMKSTGKDLVVVKSALVAANFGNVKYKTESDNREFDPEQRKAFLNGHDAGGKVSLSEQLENKDKENVKKIL